MQKDHFWSQPFNSQPELMDFISPDTLMKYCIVIVTYSITDFIGKWRSESKKWIFNDVLQLWLKRSSTRCMYFFWWFLPKKINFHWLENFPCNFLLYLWNSVKILIQKKFKKLGTNKGDVLYICFTHLGKFILHILQCCLSFFHSFSLFFL